MAAIEEQLCRVEIERDGERGEFVARVYSQLDGEKEYRHRDLDTLLRELTVDLEDSFGEAVRGAAAPEPPPGFDEDGGFVDEEKF